MGVKKKEKKRKKKEKFKKSNEKLLKKLKAKEELNQKMLASTNSFTSKQMKAFLERHSKESESTDSSSPESEDEGLKLKNALNKKIGQGEFSNNVADLNKLQLQLQKGLIGLKSNVDFGDDVPGRVDMVPGGTYAALQAQFGPRPEKIKRNKLTEVNPSRPTPINKNGTLIANNSNINNGPTPAKTRKLIDSEFEPLPLSPGSAKKQNASIQALVGTGHSLFEKITGNKPMSNDSQVLAQLAHQMEKRSREQRDSQEFEDGNDENQGQSQNDLSS